MPITLLSINVPQEQNYRKEIIQALKEINEIVDTLTENKLSPAKKLVLKNKFISLQNILSGFVESPNIPVKEKQEIILQINPQLIDLGNRLMGFDDTLDKLLLTSNYVLLHHLCSSVASNPKEVVIGVSNVLAQVLTMGSIEPEVKAPIKAMSKQQFFTEFSIEYNYLLSSAGLFTAVVTGLPGISTISLGNWAEQALQRLAKVVRFIQEHYSPLEFYQIDIEHHLDRPFDTTSDILKAFLFMNEFFAALAARADLLSGLTLPKELSPTGEPIVFQSVEQITRVLSQQIIKNCDYVDEIIKQLKDLYYDGQINKNDNPAEDSDLKEVIIRCSAWRIISLFGQYLTSFFQNKELPREIIPTKNNKFSRNKGYEKYEESLETLIFSLHYILSEIRNMVKASNHEFLHSSHFQSYKEFLKYLVMMFGVHDLYMGKEPWFLWLKEHYAQYLTEDAIGYNPINALLNSLIEYFKGVILDEKSLIFTAVSNLQKLIPYFEYEQHHYVSIKLLMFLAEIYIQDQDFKEKVNDIISFLTKIEKELSISENSLLLSKINLYKGMLMIMKETGVFIRKENERLVPFDPFSWLQVPKKIGTNFPYTPMNTALDNLTYD